MPRLPSSIEIMLTAKAVLDQHGDQAEVHIAGRIADLAKANDLLGMSVWRDVRRAIAELRKMQRKPDEPLN